MSDAELIETLRKIGWVRPAERVEELYNEWRINADGWQNALDRIEELEAKLAEQIEWVKGLADDLIAAEGREARLKEKLAECEARLGKAVEDAEKYQRAFAAQSRKLQAVLHIEGVRATLAEIKGESHDPL